MSSLVWPGNKQKYENTPIFIEKVSKNKKLTQFELYQFSVTNMVGTKGFEPLTSCSQSKRSTKLSYVPAGDILLLSFSLGKKKKTKKGRTYFI